MTDDVNANFLDDSWWETANAWDVKDEIAKGADVNAKNEYGSPVLLLSVDNNADPDVIKTLLDSGADVNAKDDDG